MTDEELNAIIAPWRDRIADFKEATQISWLHIVPAILKFSVKLHLQARGAEWVRLHYENIIRGLDAAGGIPVAAHLEFDRPPISKEQFTQLVDLLGEIAQQTFARGYQLEQVANGFATFSILLGERVTHGDPWLVKSMIAETARDLEDGAKDG